MCGGAQRGLQWGAGTECADSPHVAGSLRGPRLCAREEAELLDDGVDDGLDDGTAEGSGSS